MTYLGKPGLWARLDGVVRSWLEGDPPFLGPRRNVLVIGHRGAPRFEAENTLPSFRRALEQGANAIETDICATRDGQFVLWHDADPDDAVALLRQVRGERLLFRPEAPDPGSPPRRKVRELDLEELRRHYSYVRAPGNPPDGATPAREASIATLAELLAWAPGQPRLSDVVLDLKLEADQTAGAEALVDLLQTAVEAGEVPGLTFRLLSPQAEIVNALVARCRRSPPGDPIRVSADFELPGAPEIAPRTGTRDVSLGRGRRAWLVFRRDVARCVEARDRSVFDCVIAWTVSEAEKLRELVCIGTDGILTDDVATLRWIVVDTRNARPARRAPSRKTLKPRIPWTFLPGSGRAKPFS
jgi:glycerophosphoryl diester phosphodiesterase